MNRLLIYITGLVVLFTLSNCAPIETVKVDLKSFNENPEEYEGKRVIFKTNIEALSKNSELYSSKDVEISGFVLKGPSGLDWVFLLANEAGTTVRCYERTYRNYPWLRADMAVKQARRNKEQITIVGKLSIGFGIELDWIEYQGQIIDTDYKPYRPLLPFW